MDTINIKKKQKQNNPDEFNIEFLPEEFAQYDLSFKIIVIGDSGVGKSCLSTRSVKDNFEEFYQATVGFEFLTFNLRLNETAIKLQIWDTCGQEIYRSLITNFYRNSSLAILVYAIDNIESFHNASSWLIDLKKQANPEVKVFLVGNKCDLEEKRKVTKDMAEKFTKEKNIDLFFETSAKTGYNAKNILIEAAKILYKDYLAYRQKGEDEKNQDMLKLKNRSNTGKGNKKCC